MFEHPPFSYYLFAIIGPMIAIRGITVLLNQSFLEEWSKTHVRTVRDIWNAATLRLLISIAILLMLKEKPEWVGTLMLRTSFLAMALLIGGMAIYELVTLRKRAGKSLSPYSYKYMKLNNIFMVIGGLSATYAFWIHPIIFGQNLIGIEQ